MRIFSFASVLAVLFVTAPLAAQSGADPSGHWEGAIQLPDKPLALEIDVLKSAKGEWTATLNNPAEHLKGVPLADVSLDGSTLKFAIKGSKGGRFELALAADNRAVSGSFTTSEGNYTLPFTATRTGEARVESVPPSPAIRKEFEGVWAGDLDLSGKTVHIVLKLANQPDGTASGTIRSNNDDSDFPVAIVQKDASLSVELKITGGSFSGTLGADNASINGAWMQGGYSLPLTFRRSTDAK